ncbi:unnamed protein product, partial [Heterotrigona itama]
DHRNSEINFLLENGKDKNASVFELEACISNCRNASLPWKAAKVL